MQECIGKSKILSEKIDKRFVYHRKLLYFCDQNLNIQIIMGISKEDIVEIFGISIDVINEICQDKNSEDITPSDFQQLINIYGSDDPNVLLETGLALIEEEFVEYALPLFIKSSELGNANASYNVGAMYENGHGAQQDYAKAFEYYMKACELGDIDSLLKIGMYYDNGQGIQQNSQKAFEYYMKAAKAGCPEATYYVGYMYEYGEGIAQDYSKALEFYN